MHMPHQSSAASRDPASLHSPNTAHLDLIDLHRKHGPLVRTAPHVVSVADSAMIPLIYGATEKFKKPAFYPIQCISWRKQPAMNLFSTRDPEQHRVEKRKVGAAYSLGNLLAMEDQIDSCTRLFCDRMEEANKSPIDLGAWLQYYAFNVVGEPTFSQKLGFLEGGQDVDGMMKAIEGMLAYASMCGQVPWWHNVLLGNPLLTKLAPAMEHWNQVLIFTLKAINSRTELQRDGELNDAAEQGADMLSRWHNVKSTDPLKMTTRDIIVHLSTNNHEAMAKMRAEIDEADGKGLLTHPIRYKEVTAHLPYFCAVLKEAMRLNPSVGLIMERHVPPQGANICGKEIPGGTIVGINPWVLNYDESLFERPESFEPSRWIDGTKEELQGREHILSLNFGAGARGCIGKHTSLIEMHKILPEMYRRFDVKLVRPDEPWKTTNHWFVQQEGLICTLAPRAQH
ncbi:cytochrome P450 oxidoreductase [Neohortaea acidophila]|uniref:Cytochrome P450 oxidoreductase n=1 Tax=Neohortaea acidophila TaxID=245834 RepID=A0A6A6PTL1_9PEZI|nr:cytochrome P450 oxidoreductase [Neohortaea acidophila]KAF2483106.1 cytochrome P450 oxidoreductase [Neohortaea acidophila]